MRKRPFAQFHEHTLQPQFEAELINNGSYPSGPTCRGWMAKKEIAKVLATNKH